MAASSGDGVVDIVQQVLVANMGAAGANTGGNALGGGVATLNAEDAFAIVMMAAFMSEMLALVHQEANGATMESVSRGIDVPFQGILLRLDATFEGLDTTFTDAGGAQANLRQVTIVVSLGLANSNTGHNEATTEIAQGNTVNELQAGDSVQVLALERRATSSGRRRRGRRRPAGSHLSANQRRRHRLPGPTRDDHAAACHHGTGHPDDDRPR